MNEKPISKALKTARSVEVVKPRATEDEFVSRAEVNAEARKFLKELRQARSKQD